MRNRFKLLCLIAFTSAMAALNGCTVGDSKPVFGKEAYQEDKTQAKVAWCLEHDDAWGCPGMPCVDSLCVLGSCESEQKESTGMCCMPDDPDCDALSSEE